MGLVAALLSALIAFLVYLRTVAPTIGFWDTGEIVACAAILGVPHPPGAPLYLLVARLASLVPVTPDVARRVNLLSGLSTSAAVFLVCLIIMRLLELAQGEDRRAAVPRLARAAGGAAGALALAFSDATWWNALEAEIYAPSLLLVALAVWLALRAGAVRDGAAAARAALLAAWVVGLATGVHILIVLAIPALVLLALRRTLPALAAGAAALAAVYPGIVKGVPWLLARGAAPALALGLAVALAAAVAAARRGRRRLALLLGSFLLVVLGYSTYGAIVLRSAHDPAIDENDPETPARFLRYVNREQYGSWSIRERRAPLWDYQVKTMYVRYLGWQFAGKEEPVPGRAERDPTLTLNGLWGLPLLLSIAGAVRHARADPRRSGAVLLLFLMTGLAVVAYVNHAVPQPRERDYSYTASFFAIALWIGIGASTIIEGVSALAPRGRTRLGRILAAEAAAVVLLLVPGRMLAAGWTSHDRSRSRTAFDFAHDLLMTCAPGAVLVTGGDNDTFPLWCLQEAYGIRRDVRVVNHALLASDWYVEALERRDPGITRGLAGDGAGRLRLDPEALARPLYVAITLDEEIIDAFEPHLLLEGLAFRVLPERVPPGAIDAERTRRNLLEVYRARGFADPELARDRTFAGLLDRYRRVFLVLAQHEEQAGSEAARERIGAVLARMEEVMPEARAPVLDGGIEIGLGRLWERAGRAGELRRRIDGVLRRHDLAPPERAAAAAAFLRSTADLDRAEEAARALLAAEPGSEGARSFLAAVRARRAMGPGNAPKGER